MEIHSIIPHPSISHYVNNIVVIGNSHAYGTAVLPLIATGYPSITFQITGEGPLNRSRIDNLVLYGQNIRPIQLHTAGHITVIAYFLYPHVLKTLFGFDAKETTDAGIDLGLSDPARKMSLKEQLLNADSLNTRLQLMNSYVLKLSEFYRSNINHTISLATQIIQSHKGLVPLVDVQKQLYVTERTLQRLFDLHVGVSPKTFSRICQFRSALQQLGRNRFSDMAGVAFENGYADQSHLIRAFKEFTEHSPLEYLKLASEFPG